MNVQAKFLALAKEKGIEEAQIQISKSKSLSFSLFRGEIDSYSVNDQINVFACGIIGGKLGTCSTEKIGADTAEFLVDGIQKAIAYNEREGHSSLFPGSEKYHKKNIFNKELGLVHADKKIALLHQIEDKLKAYDERILEVAYLQYEESEGSSTFDNSYGLKLSQKSNYFVVAAQITVKDGEGVKSAFKIDFGTDLSTFDVDKFVEALAKDGLSKIGAEPCLSGKYPTILSYDSFAPFVSTLVASASSEAIQKKSSFLIDKLNQKVAASRINIVESPLEKNIFFSYFDDEGVAKYKKDIVKGGVLKTYLYNRDTAAKDGVTTTGNGSWAGGKMGIGFDNLIVKGSKKSFEEMIAPIKEGVYITDLQGLGTGMNSQSGDFSCQAQGFMIRDGKIAEPLTLITISGNVLKLFQDIKDMDNNCRLTLSRITLPDVYIKSMSIGGK